MPKQDGQKEKILLLMQIFESETDEQHPLTVNQLLERLKQRGISAERKSIYDDIRVLHHFGMDLELQRGRGGGYYLNSRPFELAEIKLLVDAVQSARFITARKSSALIHKLQTLCSRHEAGTLARQVYVSGRIKNMNESIYYNVDALHTALAHHHQITFYYFHWEFDSADFHSFQKCRHRDGAVYTVSPFALLMDDGNYYLAGYDHDKQEIRHFRVDKMERIQETKKNCGPQELLQQFHVPNYMKTMFGMFSGTPVSVKLQVKNHLAGAVFDRFGTECTMIPGPEHTFYIHISVVPSPQFFSFVAGFGDGMKICEPASIVQEMKKQIAALQNLYQEDET